MVIDPVDGLLEHVPVVLNLGEIELNDGEGLAERNSGGDVHGGGEGEESSPIASHVCLLLQAIDVGLELSVSEGHSGGEGVHGLVLRAIVESGDLALEHRASGVGPMESRAA